MSKDTFKREDLDNIKGMTIYSDESMGRIWDNYKEQYPMEDLLDFLQEVKDDMRKRSQEIMF